jgi:hypothetical protein
VTDTYEDFACACGVDGEPKSECDAEVERVRVAIGLSPENFCTGVIASLEHDFNASIESVHYDQWGAIVTERTKIERQPDGDVDFTEEIEHRTSIQFDRFEHGLARTWLHYADTYGWPDYTREKE